MWLEILWSFLYESCEMLCSCRVGAKRIVEILNRMMKAEGEPSDLENLRYMGEHIKSTSFCV